MHLSLTQETLAAACDVSQSSVVGWELGTSTPRPSSLKALSRVLRVPEKWLNGGEEIDEESLGRLPGSAPIGEHKLWPSIRAKLSGVYSADVLDQVSRAAFDVGPEPFVDLEYARKLADAIAYARSQSIR